MTDQNHNDPPQTTPPREGDQPPVDRGKASAKDGRSPWTARIGAIAAAVAALVALLTFVIAQIGGSGTPEAKVGVVPVVRNPVVPRPVSSLPSPPPYPSSERGDHCARWRGWFEQVGAEQTGPVLQVSAPTSAPVTVTDVRSTVYRAFRPQAVTGVVCALGAGPLAGTTLLHSLDNPAAPSTLSSQAAGKPVRMPPGEFKVPAGGSEQLAVEPHGGNNQFYEWSLTLDVTVDQRSKQISIGSASHPLRTYIGPRFERGFEYNPASHSWVKSAFTVG